MTIAFFFHYPIDILSQNSMFSFCNCVSVISDVRQSKMVGVVISQVYLSFWGVIGGGAGRWELWCYAQRHLLQWGVVTGGVVTTGVGTTGRWEAWPVLLSSQPHAPIGQASQAPPLLIRHKRGQFRGVAGLADGRRLTGHPTGIWVTQLTALLTAVSRHSNIRQWANICERKAHKKSSL